MLEDELTISLNTTQTLREELFKYKTQLNYYQTREQEDRRTINDLKTQLKNAQFTRFQPQDRYYHSPTVYDSHLHDGPIDLPKEEYVPIIKRQLTYSGDSGEKKRIFDDEPIKIDRKTVNEPNLDSFDIKLLKHQQSTDCSEANSLRSSQFIHPSLPNSKPNGNILFNPKNNVLLSMKKQLETNIKKRIHRNRNKERTFFLTESYS